MRTTSHEDELPDLLWGRVAGLAGGLVAAYLTVRGAAAAFRMVAREVEDHAFDAGWMTRRG